MVARMRTLLMLPVLALALVLTSCEPPTDTPAGPPTESERSELLLDSSSSSDEESEWTRIEGRIPSHIDDISLSKLIGVDGGSITLAGHTLTVPAGAVDEPTLFTMTLVTDGYVEVELTALTESLLGLLGLSAEVTEFERPVTVSLTYAWAKDVDDPDDLVILRIDESTDFASGDHEALETTVDKDRKLVTAELDHFSRYCIASN